MKALLLKTGQLNLAKMFRSIFRPLLFFRNFNNLENVDCFSTGDFNFNGCSKLVSSLATDFIDTLSRLNVDEKCTKNKHYLR